MSKEGTRVPRKSTKHQECLLKRIWLQGPLTSTAELAQEWKQAGVSASARIVRQRMLEADLPSQRVAKKPLLFREKHKRLTSIMQQISRLDPEDWDVIFIDEVSFRLPRSSRNFLAWR